ncbi:hypothetical protein [Streptomyces sp. NBC_00470]|uniref:hypothetical protein n=1 Tax=Streptomyces sp. NBC_00470 TaxID=2975753 RepID=UPI0030DE027A
MAELPHALRTALDGYYGSHKAVREVARPITHRQGLTARLNALEKAYGGPKAAAAAVGTVPDTWRRWKKGQRKPKAANLEKISTVHKSLQRALRVQAKGVPTHIVIHAVVVCNATPVNRGPKADRARAAGNRYVNVLNSGPHRNKAPARSGYRPFRADALTHAQRQDVVNAYAAGASPRAVADILVSAIERQYGEPFGFEGHNVIVEIT